MIAPIKGVLLLGPACRESKPFFSYHVLPCCSCCTLLPAWLQLAQRLLKSSCSGCPGAWACQQQGLRRHSCCRCCQHLAWMLCWIPCLLFKG